MLFSTALKERERERGGGGGGKEGGREEEEVSVVERVERRARHCRWSIEETKRLHFSRSNCSRSRSCDYSFLPLHAAEENALVQATGMAALLSEREKQAQAACSSTARRHFFDALANFFQKEKLHGAALNIPHHDAKSSHKSSTRTPHDSRGVKKSREELTQRAGKAADSDWFFGEPRRV